MSCNDLRKTKCGFRVAGSTDVGWVALWIGGDAKGSDFSVLAFAAVRVASAFGLAAEWLLPACSLCPVAQSCLILWDP